MVRGQWRPYLDARWDTPDKRDVSRNIICNFFFFQEDICCGYSLDASHEKPQHIFPWRNEKKNQNFWLKKAPYLELYAGLWLHCPHIVKEPFSVDKVHIISVFTTWRDLTYWKESDTWQIILHDFARGYYYDVHHWHLNMINKKTVNSNIMITILMHSARYM